MTAHTGTRHAHTNPSAKHLPGHDQLATITVPPHEQPHITLGMFSLEDLNHGFAVAFTHCSDPLAAVSQIIPLETRRPDRYKVILQVANYSDEPFEATVERI